MIGNNGTKPFIKQLIVDNKHFIYDVNTNNIIEVDKAIYSIISLIDLEKNEIYSSFKSSLSEKEILNALNAIHEGQEKTNLFLSSRPKQLSFFSEEEIINKLESNLEYVCLEVTEECNLRCQYCPYSNTNPYKRNHSLRRMNDYESLNAINFLIDHSKKSNKVIVNFYGGEPLLNFPVIKKCINYTKKRAAKDEVIFNISTNGTLLNSDTVDFLVENGVKLAVSIDGPKAIHDRYRRFPSGAGSFDIIEDNLIKIKEKYPIFYSNNIIFLCVLAPPYELIKANEYWKSMGGESRDPRLIIASYMNPNGDPGFLKYINDRDAEYHKKEYKLLYEEFLNSVINNRLTPCSLSDSLFRSRFSAIHKKIFPVEPFKDTYFYKNICIPGGSRLFMNCRGEFYMCENMAFNENKIGDIRNGFDYRFISEFVKSFLFQANHDCTNCWALRLCDFCYLPAKSKKGISMDQRKENCDRFKEELENDLRAYIKLSDKDSRLFDSIVYPRILEQAEIDK